MAGWLAYDDFQLERAGQHFAQALGVAAAANNPGLQAHTLASQSHLALEHGRASASVELATAGLALVPSTSETARQLRAKYDRKLKELSAREDSLLDLVGDPDWSKEKLTAKIRAVREERTRLQERLAESDRPLDAGYEVLATVLRLLDDPQALYRRSGVRARKVLNTAVFTRLHLDVEAEPVVMSDTFNEPFAASVEARRAWSLGEAVDGVLAERGEPDRPSTTERRPPDG